MHAMLHNELAVDFKVVVCVHWRARPLDIVTFKVTGQILLHRTAPLQDLSDK